MKNKMFKVLIALLLISISSCSQNAQTIQSKEITTSNQEKTTAPMRQTARHSYGGWYCPDNLNGFPATNISNWENVPVINGRMPTKEETRDGSSLIFVDIEKYPNAKPLDMEMPKLAKFFNQSSNREELIIVIQAVNIDNDSIVGFRYLNGGNGSSWLSEVSFLLDNEIEMLPKARFVSLDITINNTQEEIWDILTNPASNKALQHIFDKEKKLKADWRYLSNVNYNYANSGNIKAAYAKKHYGSYYIQNDYDHLGYNEKFLLLEDTESKTTTLKIVCGPFTDNFEAQESILKQWAEQVKLLSEF